MQVGLHANMSDQATNHVAVALIPTLKELSERLSGEYGGIIEHLWIDVELIEAHARPDGKSRFPFRFQKRVSGRSNFGLPAGPDKFNVGHYSVRPNFLQLAYTPSKNIVPYVLSIIYESTSVLLLKSKKLGGFDAVLFRQSFLRACEDLGFKLAENAL